MTVLALKLLLAHILGDFVLQPYNWVKDKEEKKHRSIYLYLHAMVHAVTLLVVLGFDKKYWLGVVIIVSTHLIIDWIKVSIESKAYSRWLFAVDQLAHLTVIAFVVHWYEPYTLPLEPLGHPKLLLLVTAILSVTLVSSVIMKIIMQPWELELQNEPSDSLKNAGHYIGMLERLFVFGFILLQQWQAIGFLFAAKSVFRFNDLSKAKDRKLTEYILIGTLLSFGLALLVGLMFNYINLKL